MLDIINRPELLKFCRDFKAGEDLFLEGDDSRDMYILVSGRLEIFKDDKLISGISAAGAMVGEMSHLLGSRRTATVRAGRDSRVMVISSDRIADFFQEFPELIPHITQSLAERLHETTRVMHGLREFCDQLPDAVIMTDREMNILAWNRAAEMLHGRTWQEINGRPLAEIFLEPAEYRHFIDDVRAGRSLYEKIIAVRHPEEADVFASVSTTVLYDGHHNVEGFIFLSRDVTRVKKLEDQYRRFRKLLVPALIACGLLAAALFFSIPYFSKGLRVLDLRKESFRNRIVQDSQSLAAAIPGLESAGDNGPVQQVIQDYFADRSAELNGINGLVLLDRDKKVIAAFSPFREDRGAAMVGSSYSGITFRGDNEARCRHLTLFRSDKHNPMGVQGEEIACALPQGGWFVFQLDMERLSRDFGIEAGKLDKIDF